MKIIATILSLYMLAIACLPCCDRQECSVASESQIVMSLPDHDAHDHSTECCSPFCICACCVSVAQIEHAEVFSFDRPEVIATLFHHVVPIVSYDDSAIWQPPKIG